MSDLDRLANALYAVRSLCPSRAVLGIFWMHPIRGLYYPVQRGILCKERENGGGRANSRREQDARDSVRIFGPLLWRFIGYVAYSVRLFLSLVRLRWHFREEINALRQQRFDIVAKTWCFGPERSPDGRDFYYGDMQRRLADRGVRMLFLCGDVSGTDRKVFAKAHISSSGLCRLPELCLVPPFAVIRMAFEQLAAWISLRRIATKASDPLIKRVSLYASRDCLSRQGMFGGLYYSIGKKAVKTWRPQAFITLYEGHGWEKCAWWGAKDADRSCKSVGYQHTVLFASRISLLRPHLDRREYSVPDVVLCTGDETKRMMLPGYLRQQSRLITFGSFRRDSEGGVGAAPKPGKRTVLVLPEGVASEAKLLFDAAIQAASLLLDHRFIFRCHPELPFHRIRPHLNGAPEDHPNIEISNHNSIAEDFARSSVVLSRGSSAVLYAVLRGLKPVYLHDDRHDDIDPLFELTSWRECVSSAREMEQVLRRYAAQTTDCAFEEWRSAAEYVSAYTMPVDVASIDRFLAAVALPTVKSNQ